VSGRTLHRIALLAAGGLALLAVASTKCSRVAGQSAQSSAELRLTATDYPRAGDRLEISGHIEGNGIATIVLRIDDVASRDYASRVNVERVFPPGPFHWRTVLGGLVTPSGRPIDIARLTRVMAFKAAGNGRVTIDRINLTSPVALPAGARGYALGAQDAPLPEGFERIAPGDHRLLGGAPVAVRRPLPDPLTANGLKGLDRVRLPSPAGRVRVTVWTEDPGEWEMLPHVLRRRILINGRVALDERYDASEWTRYRYLAGRDDEHTEADDAWLAFGSRRARGHTVEVDVDSDRDGLTIVLDGAEPAARYLSAVLVEPAGDGRARERVEADRVAWYRESWPVLRKELQDEDQDVGRVHWSTAGLAADRPLRVRLAPDGGARLRVRIDGLTDGQTVTPNLVPPAGVAPHLVVYAWAARQRLDRRNAQESFLTLSDNTLHAAGTIPTGSAPGTTGRLVEFWIAGGANLPTGRHTLELRVSDHNVRHAQPVSLEVIDVALPKAVKPAGVYLEESPHLTWFDGLQTLRDRQVACDARFVATLGLTGSAPALATPLGNGEALMATDLHRARDAGLEPRALAYAPAKRVLSALGPQAGAVHLTALSARLAEKRLDPPIWSIADEPDNPGGGALWKSWLDALRAVPGSGPRPILAGHLNSAKDRALAGLFDVALVNPGYGLDAASIAETARSGPEVWLYNTGAPRVAAGVWLWRTAARRYLQWHARMPTAHPFDPIDGREGDEQLILPSAEPCPKTPAIHRDLLELAEGVVDQRWLTWLAGRTEPEAQALAAGITARVGDRWRAAAALSRHDLRSIRESIIELAAHLSDRR